MFNAYDSYRQVRLVRYDDADYIAFMRRMADKRPTRGGPRHAGEVLGGLTERCVRHWLSGHVSLQDERILTWEQRQKNGRHGAMYRELDAVWRIDDESLCLYEMKLTFPENMERGVGLKQLNIAAQTLFTNPLNKYILKRLVYIAEEPLDVLEGEIPVLAPNDEYEEVGVVWVTPAEVENAARALEIELPENWLEPESREGHIENPEREEWRQYASTDAKPEEADEDDAPADNPLAEALRRLMQNEGESQ